MVPSATDVLAGVPGRAALPDEDVAGEDFLACVCAAAVVSPLPRCLADSP